MFILIGKHEIHAVQVHVFMIHKHWKGMVRQLASNEEKRSCALRRLSGDDRGKMMLLLGKVVLPKDYEEDEDEVNASPVNAVLLGHSPRFSPQQSPRQMQSTVTQDKCPLATLLSKELMQEYTGMKEEETAIVPYKRKTYVMAKSPRPERGPEKGLEDDFSFPQIDMIHEMQKFLGDRHVEKEKNKRKRASSADLDSGLPAHPTKISHKPSAPAKPSVKPSAVKPPGRADDQKYIAVGAPASASQRAKARPQGCSKCKYKEGCTPSCWKLHLRSKRATCREGK